MKKLKFLSWMPGLLLASQGVFADAGWTGYATVTEINPTGTHYYQVRLELDKNPSDCRNKQWFFQDYVTPGSDKMFATLLEALSTGGQVRLYVTGRCNLDQYSEFSSVSYKR